MAHTFIAAARVRAEDCRQCADEPAEREWCFVGPSLQVMEKKWASIAPDKDFLSQCIPSVVAAGTGTTPSFDSKWFMEHALQPVFSEVAYSALSPMFNATHGIVNAGHEGDCAEFALRLQSIIVAQGAGLEPRIVPATAPPLFSPDPERHDAIYSHLLVLVPIAEGLVILDPSFHINQPVFLVASNGYSDTFEWPTATAAQLEHAEQVGKTWRFKADFAKGRIDVTASFPDEADGVSWLPAYHILLREAFPSVSCAPSLRIMQLRQRLGVVRTDSEGVTLAHLSIRLDTQKIELCVHGAWRERLPFPVVTSAAAPVAALQEWVGTDGLAALALTDPLEILSAVAAIVLAASAPISAAGLCEARLAHMDVVAAKTSALYDTMPGAAAMAHVPVYIEVQLPWSMVVLQRKKSVETRTYPYPANLIGKRVFILQTQKGATGVSGLPDQIQADDPNLEVVGECVVNECVLYPTRRSWDLDYTRHKVPLDNPYGWSTKKDFFGWVVSNPVLYDISRPVPKLTRIHRSFFRPDAQPLAAPVD